MKDSTTDNEFQVLNMNYKIKNIKKKRKAHNIGKIEEFSILSNVRPEPEPAVVEGFTDDDWEGQDDVRSQKGALGEFGARLVDIFNDIYTMIIFGNCYLSFYLANFCADDSIQVKQNIDWNFMHQVVKVDVDGDNNAPFNGENLGVDQKIIDGANQVYQYLCFVESLIFAYLFSFGWFYVIFYNYYKKKLNDSALEGGQIGKEQGGICIAVESKYNAIPEKKSENNLINMVSGKMGLPGGMIGGQSGGMDFAKIAHQGMKLATDPENAKMVEGITGQLKNGAKGVSAMDVSKGVDTGAVMGMLGRNNPLSGVSKAEGFTPGDPALDSKPLPDMQTAEKCVNPGACHFFSRKKLSENPNVLTILLMFFIEYSLAIFETLCFFLETVVPKTLDSIQMPPAICYLLVFITIYLFNNNFLLGLKNLIPHVIDLNYADMTLVVLTLVVAFHYVSSYFKKEEAFWNDPLFLHILSSSLLICAFYTLLLFIKEILRLAVIFLFSIPFGAMMCVAYVLYISIITNFVKFSQKNVREGVVNYIRHSVVERKVREPQAAGVLSNITGYTDDIKFKFTSILNYISIFFYNYFIFCLLILCSLYGLAYTKIIDDVGLLQQMMQYFNLGLIVIVVAMVLYVLRYYIQSGATDIPTLLIAVPFKSFMTILESTYYIIFAILLVFVVIVTIAFLKGGTTYFGQMLDKASKKVNASADSVDRSLNSAGRSLNSAVTDANNGIRTAKNAINGLGKSAPAVVASDAEKDWNALTDRISTLGSSSSIVAPGAAPLAWNKSSFPPVGRASKMPF